jgi:hypothetical protein
MSPHPDRACGGQPRASAQVIRAAGCLRAACVALGDLTFAAAVGGTAADRIDGSRRDRAGLADALLDFQSSEGGFEGVHVGLRVWDRVGQIR